MLLHCFIPAYWNECKICSRLMKWSIRSHTTRLQRGYSYYIIDGKFGNVSHSHLLVCVTWTNSLDNKYRNSLVENRSTSIQKHAIEYNSFLSFWNKIDELIFTKVEDFGMFYSFAEDANRLSLCRNAQMNNKIMINCAISANHPFILSQNIKSFGQKRLRIAKNQASPNHSVKLFIKFFYITSSNNAID